MCFQIAKQTLGYITLSHQPPSESQMTSLALQLRCADRIRSTLSLSPSALSEPRPPLTTSVLRSFALKFRGQSCIHNSRSQGKCLFGQKESKIKIERKKMRSNSSHKPSSQSINIAASAQRLDVDNRISLRYYFRIADNILKQVSLLPPKNLLIILIFSLRMSFCNTVFSIII